MKRILCALLALSLLVGTVPAMAITGQEALGLTEGGETGSRYPTLQIGSRDGDDAGAYVVMLQNRLLELGYLASAADGQYGAMTESAVLLFQENNGLTPTGIADDSTQSLLFSTSAQRAPEKVAADSEALRVQQALLRWGFMVGAADGVAGTTTQTAVAEFKDYIYNTCRLAYAAYATPAPTPEATLAPDVQPVAMDVPLDATQAPESNGQSGEITEAVVRFADGDYEFQVYQQTLQSGSRGAEVWRVQRRLCQLRYLYKPDGSYGGLTENALKYFQRKNGLQETGVADEATQRKLFSGEAVSSEEYVFPYKLFVSLDDQRVYAYGWDGSGYTKEVKKFKCSTGMAGYDTPSGTYQAGGRVTFDEWYYFKDYNCYAKYAYRIVGGVLFHSVLYSAKKKGPTNSSVNALGRKASHGCVRLAVENAQWICENCPEGTTVVIG